MRSHKFESLSEELSPRRLPWMKFCGQIWWGKKTQTSRFCRSGVTPTPEKSHTRTVDGISPPYLSSSSHQFNASLLFPSPKEYSPVNERRPLLLLSPHTLFSPSPPSLSGYNSLGPRWVFLCALLSHPSLQQSLSCPCPNPFRRPGPSHTHAHARAQSEKGIESERKRERDAIQ